MSDIIKLPVGTKKIKAAINDFNSDLDLLTEQETEQLAYEKELDLKYKKGYDDGYKEASIKLEQEKTDEIIAKSEEFYKILSSFEEKLCSYEDSFDKIIIGVSEKICEKILQHEINNKSIIEETLKESVTKILGANSITVNLNPTDYELVTTGQEIKSMEKNFMKIKLQNDNSVEKGGCLIETEIGNVDARISTQLGEIITQLENCLTNDE